MPLCLQKKSVASVLDPGAGDVEKVGGSLCGIRHKTPDPVSPAHLKQGAHSPFMKVWREIYSQWRGAALS